MWSGVRVRSQALSQLLQLRAPAAQVGILAPAVHARERPGDVVLGRLRVPGCELGKHWLLENGGDAAGGAEFFSEGETGRSRLDRILGLADPKVTAGEELIGRVFRDRPDQVVRATRCRLGLGQKLHDLTRTAWHLRRLPGNPGRGHSRIHQELTGQP